MFSPRVYVYVSARKEIQLEKSLPSLKKGVHRGILRGASRSKHSPLEFEDAPRPLQLHERGERIHDLRPQGEAHPEVVRARFSWLATPDTLR